MNEIRPPPSPNEGWHTNLGLAGTRPTATAAPELQGRRDLVVIRDPDETDADYQARCDFVMLLFDRAEQV